MGWVCGEGEVRLRLRTRPRLLIGLYLELLVRIGRLMRKLRLVRG